MRIRPVPELADLLVIEPDVHRDDRGFFLESWQRERYREHGLDAAFVQDNHSRSRGGVLRGLHFQHPRSQGKLLRVGRGAVFDVAVDVRVGSPTFGRWHGARLSDGDHRQLWIPPGFAHGFAVLSEEADVLYKATEYYAPGAEHTLRWDDPDLGIEWPVDAPVLSEKDAGAPVLDELEAAGVLPRYRQVG